MTSYIITFVVYTTAMVGAIFLALFIYKKFSLNKQFSSQSKFLSIEDYINIGVRKQLYIVRAGKEKFLIASDSERTTFLAKLDSNNEHTDINEIFEKNVSFMKQDTPKKENDDNIFFLNEIEKGSKDAGKILHNIVKSGGGK